MLPVLLLEKVAPSKPNPTGSRALLGLLHPQQLASGSMKRRMSQAEARRSARRGFAGRPRRLNNSALSGQAAELGASGNILFRTSPSVSRSALRSLLLCR